MRRVVDAGDMLNYSDVDVLPPNASASNYSRLPTNSVWWKPLPNDSAAAVLYTSKATSTISFGFAELAWQGKPALASTKGCVVRSIWGNTTSTESGGLSVAVQAGDAVFVIISGCSGRADA